MYCDEIEQVIKEYLDKLHLCIAVSIQWIMIQ